MTPILGQIRKGCTSEVVKHFLSLKADPACGSTCLADAQWIAFPRGPVTGRDSEYSSTDAPSPLMAALVGLTPPNISLFADRSRTVELLLDAGADLDWSVPQSDQVR